MSTKTAAKTNSITLRGSAQIVSEFFGYSINMILFQRALYDPDSFDVVKKYGLSLYITNDEGLSTYLKCVLKQLAEWLALGQVKKVVIVIAEVESKEVMERWTFNIECDKEAFEAKEAREKDIKEIHKEIAALMRQITGAITFLPLLDKPCSFDILIYTHSDVEVPGEWEESDPKYIPRSSEVHLRSFSTKVHTVSGSIAFKVED